MVWVNRVDMPPELPGKWEWHEIHLSEAECLRRGSLKHKTWGELFVIMGAGTSVQDFTLLKTEADQYPFEKDLLEVGGWVGRWVGWEGGWLGGGLGVVVANRQGEPMRVCGV
jgi:hypothetical protein